MRIMSADQVGFPGVAGLGGPGHSPGCEQEARGIFSTQVYSRTECSAILGEVKKAKSWHSARVSAGDGDSEGIVDPEARSASILASANRHRLYSSFEQRVRTIVTPVLLKWWGVKLHSCDGTQLVRYKPGGQYIAHRDSSEDPAEVAYASRYFTVLCYLNSGYEGGRTSFPGLNYSATPATGKCIVFPSHYPHSATPVSGGEKFVLLTWLCGPVPLRWI